MLSEICHYLKNWFDKGQPRIHGAFEISDGKITDHDFTDVIQQNQYFRIVGSVFNDGVYKYDDELVLNDEVFVGAIWLMAIPKAFLDLVTEIEDWQKLNGSADSEAMSPFQSESFGGYSYSKGSSGSNGSSSVSWKNAYGTRLNAWRKL